MGQELALHQPDPIHSIHQPDVARPSRTVDSVPPSHTQRGVGIGHGTRKGIRREYKTLGWGGERLVKST